MGFVVSRMDHYCIWLNISIGQKNHRSFMFFLLLHTITTGLIVSLLIRALHSEINSYYSCNILTSVLSRKSFYTTTLCAFMSIIFIGLAFLTYDQLSNIANNITTNEKINSSRYSYLQDGEGNFSNRFDRGVVSNVLEFLQVPGYYVDYNTIFTLPDLGSPAPKSKEQKRSWYQQWCLSRELVSTKDDSDGLGGLSDIYASGSSDHNQFQSTDGVTAGTLEMRRRKEKDSSNPSGGAELVDRAYLV